TAKCLSFVPVLELLYINKPMIAATTRSVAKATAEVPKLHANPRAGARRGVERIFLSARFWTAGSSDVSKPEIWLRRLRKSARTCWQSVQPTRWRSTSRASEVDSSPSINDEIFSVKLQFMIAFVSLRQDLHNFHDLHERSWSSVLAATPARERCRPLLCSLRCSALSRSRDSSTVPVPSAATRCAGLRATSVTFQARAFGVPESRIPAPGCVLVASSFPLLDQTAGSACAICEIR